MSRHSTTAGDVAADCLLCDAPVAETTDGEPVCEDCRDTVVEQRRPIAPCREVSVERRGIELTKTLRTDGRVEYRLRSALDRTVAVRLRDTLGDRPVEVTWWVPPEEPVRIVRAAPDGAEHVESVPFLRVGHERGGRPSPGTNGGGEAETVLAAMPAYDEGETIGAVVAAAREHADAVLVVDDGSTDDTVARARAAGAVVVEHEDNGGYGAALKTIFRTADRAGVDRLAILDSDGQHDATDIPVLVSEARETGAEIVVGSRYGERSGTEIPAYRRVGLVVIDTLTNLSMGRFRPSAWVGDTQSGFRVYDPTAIASLAADEGVGDRMGASTDILSHAHRAGYDVAEVGTTIAYDVEEANSHNPVRHGFDVVWNLLPALEREQPLLALGLPGLLVTGAGLGATALLLGRSSGTPGAGPLFLALFVALLGTLACLAAVVVHALHAYHRYD